VEAAAQRERRAHFFGDRFAQLAFAAQVLGLYGFKQVEPVLHRNLRIAGERLASGGDRLVDVGRRAERDLARNFLCRGIDDFGGAGGDRVDPLAVNVELGVIAHALSPTRSPSFLRGGVGRVLARAPRRGRRSTPLRLTPAARGGKPAAPPAKGRGSY